MKKTSKTLLFFGNERLSTGFEPKGSPTFQRLLDAGYEIKAVIAHHGSTHSRAKRELEIENIAKARNVPVHLPEKPSDITEQLAAYHADAAVLVAYGKIIPQSLIDLFPLGIINIHPSLLPLYRGPTPIEQAIRDGAPKTGVSLMRLSSRMDDGPIFAQEELALHGNETKFELTEQLLGLGGEMLTKNLPAILDGSLEAEPQDDIKASYTSLLSKGDSWLDLAKPAQTLEREVRAFFGWPKSKLNVYGKYIIVLKARVAKERHPNCLTIECAQDTLLEITELTAPSGKTMSGSDFIRGYAE